MSVEHRIREAVGEHLSTSPLGLMRSHDLRLKVNKTLGEELHPMTFYGTMHLMERDGAVHYWKVSIRSHSGTEEACYYRLVK